jgi:hypothetical protein
MGLGKGGEERGFGDRGGGDRVWGQGRSRWGLGTRERIALLGIAGDCWGLHFRILLVTEHLLVASVLVIFLQYFSEMYGGGTPQVQCGEGYSFRFSGSLDQHLSES